MPSYCLPLILLTVASFRAPVTAAQDVPAATQPATVATQQAELRERPAVSPRTRRVVDLLLRGVRPPAHVIWQQRGLRAEALTAAVGEAFEDPRRVLSVEERRVLLVALHALRAAETDVGAGLLLAQLHDPALAGLALRSLLAHADAALHAEIVARLVGDLDAGVYAFDALAPAFGALGKLGGRGAPLAPRLEATYLDARRPAHDRAAALGAWIAIVGPEQGGEVVAVLQDAAPLVLLRGSGRGLIQAGLDRGDEAPGAYRDAVLDLLASDDADVRAEAARVLPLVHGFWGMYEEHADALRLKPAIRERLETLADERPDAGWRAAMRELLARYAVTDALFRRYQAVKRQRILTRDDPDAVRLADRDAYPGAEVMRRRVAVMEDVRRLIYELADAAPDDEGLSQTRRNRLDKHARLWAQPLLRQPEDVLGEEGRRWYLESVRRHVGALGGVESEPPGDELERWMRNASTRWIARRMVSEWERAERERVWLRASEALAEAVRDDLPGGIAIRTDAGAALTGADRAAATAALRERLAKPGDAGVLVASSVFYAEPAGGLADVVGWDVVARQVVRDAFGEQGLVLERHLAAAAPVLREALFWAVMPQAGGDREYRSAIDRARERLTLGVGG